MRLGRQPVSRCSKAKGRYIPHFVRIANRIRLTGTYTRTGSETRLPCQSKDESLPPAAIREPFFLCGRTSVMQRAAIMSLVLGGMASVAAWILTAVMKFAGEAWLPPAWGITVGLLIYAPLNWWNGRRWFWTLGAIPAGMILLWGFLWLNQAAVRASVDFIIVIGLGFTGVLIGSGVLLIRPRRLHALAYLLSVLGGIIPALVFVLAIHSAFSSAATLLGYAPGMKEALETAAILAAWLAPLSIPWGLPFWWPPERNGHPD